MTRLQRTALFTVMLLGVLFAAGWYLLYGEQAELAWNEVTGTRAKVPPAHVQYVPTLGLASPIGWKAGETPVAAAGLAVTRFAEGLDHPRTMLVLPNGDVLVAETNAPAGDSGHGLVAWITGKIMTYVGAGGASPNKLVLLRDANHDGVAEQRFVIANPALNSPFGMVFRDNHLIVANNDAVVSFPYTPGQTDLPAAPEKLMDMPKGGEHWARNLVLSGDGAKLYVSIGSGTNVADKGIDYEKGRAEIDEYDFTTKASRTYAKGLRNANGMDWNPSTGDLWTVVNERDQLGSDVPADYLASVPIGAHYGWPWIYWKKYVDPRVEDSMPEYISDYVRKPDYALGPHVAPLGLAFARGGNLMGQGFASGAFIAEHGSWNRQPMSGYEVVFVGFDGNGNALAQPPRPVLSGFLTADHKHTRGRPVWVSFAGDGALLVSDDTGGVIWRVVAPGAAPAAEIKPAVSGLVPRRKPIYGTIATPDENSDLAKPKE